MSENEKRPAALQSQKRSRELGDLLIGLFAVGLVAVGVAWVFYRVHFSPVLTTDREEWGQLGDFIGGVTNPILSFLALIALLMTVKLQGDQLSAVREELHEARDAQSAAAEAHRRQLAQAEALVATQLRTAVAQETAASALADQLLTARQAAREQSQAAHDQLEHTRALVQAQHATTAAQHHAAEQQQRSAHAMERAAAAQEAAARALEAQVSLAKSTAHHQAAAAAAQVAAAVHSVMDDAQRSGRNSGSPETQKLFGSSEQSFAVLNRALIQVSVGSQEEAKA